MEMPTEIDAYNSSSDMDSADRIQQLTDDARRHMARSRSDSTRKAYVSDFSDFATWCAEIGTTSLPATPETVALFVTERARTLALSTLRRRVAAIAVAHQMANHPSPTRSNVVHEVMVGIARNAADLGLTARKADALTIGKLRQVLGGITGTDPASIRDRALLLLGFAGGFRRSELVALRCSDLEVTSEGLRVKVRRSKTDQLAVGAEVGIPYGREDDTCPVRAVADWLDLACGTIEDGHVFRRVRRNGLIGSDPLTPQTVALITKARAVAVGIDPAVVSGHSLRRGMATTLARAGASEREIAKRGRWRQGSLVVRGYVADGGVFVDSGADKLGL